jgi:DNA-directed RNA polymerase subunit RPC12/RpoP
MTSELIKCPHCGYKYYTDVEKIMEDGTTVAVRFGLSDIKKVFSRKTPKSLYIDLTCPNCKKEFKWEVKV